MKHTNGTNTSYLLPLTPIFLFLATKHSKIFPGVASESDLQKWRMSKDRKSPSLSQMGPDSIKHKVSIRRSDMSLLNFSKKKKKKDSLILRFHPLQFSLQDNGSAKYFQGAMHTSNMGEKVAQVSHAFRKQISIGFLDRRLDWVWKLSKSWAKVRWREFTCEPSRSWNFDRRGEHHRALSTSSNKLHVILEWEEKENSDSGAKKFLRPLISLLLFFFLLDTRRQNYRSPFTRSPRENF